MRRGSQRKHLEIGDRVMPSRHGLRELRWAFRNGTTTRALVLRRVPGMEPALVRVRFDGREQPETYHEDYLTLTLKRGEKSKG